MDDNEDRQTYTRKGVNSMAGGRVLQRGQVMTWSLSEKKQFFEQHNIGMVVNFWSKLDADMGECYDVQYVYVPTPHSKDIMDISNSVLADYVSLWLAMGDRNVLVLCEAGKTRSVFFCVLLLSTFQTTSMTQALKEVEKTIPGHKLKADMLRYIKETSK